MRVLSALSLTVLVLLAGGATRVRTQGQEVFLPGNGITNPAIILQPQPRYTEQAMRAGIQGDVELEAVILPNGTVGEIRVLKSLDNTFGLDQEAIAAAKRWLFKPGMRNGAPVPVRVTLVLTFRMTGKPISDFALGTFAEDTQFLTKPVVKTAVPMAAPAGAGRQTVEGEVTVEAVVAADGTVARARVKPGTPPTVQGFDEAAVAAVKQWTFEPGVLGGLKVPVVVTVTVRFQLRF